MNLFTIHPRFNVQQAMYVEKKKKKPLKQEKENELYNKNTVF